MILFVNACVRAASRTKRLADALIEKINDDVCELILEDVPFPVVTEDFLKKRDTLIAMRKFDDPMFDLARQFASADRIVIAAPFWDLSFPAMLKQYLEQINVLGITFEYTPQGVPKGLCRAGRLDYVTTAGGDFFPEIFGYGYVKALAQNFYGIQDVALFKANGLDLAGADAEKIMRDAISELNG